MPGALLAAVDWINKLLSGGLGAAIAILMIALTGFRMLWGMCGPKEMVRIVLGCAILFGAPRIAAALLGLDVAGSGAIATAPRQPPLAIGKLDAIPDPSSLRGSTTNPFDPYAGGAGAMRNLD